MSTNNHEIKQEQNNMRLKQIDQFQGKNRSTPNPIIISVLFNNFH